ncbi:hypothetical protein VC83_08801 [Pseudogymnoascus destructans]|uniref:DUF1996 domain-containing protein n=2 Tax=Pseudogymnoascus destructans TaxID=655981 RepID=L8FZ57_PSED2|nr:uncharacterized protein VC83_08801 [Pseudogymnoascus destructans]ELR05829.1 hypothetical protein GMDG_07602 [Pseudogymnoascus destructans 20631-21]OAF54634.1 hypothetical protein VC83_08801 [Pseudogymnoascus destructans]
MKFTTATAAMVLAGSAEAFWRMECRGRSGLARIDPLVNPGVASMHAHTIFGSSGFTTTSGSDELLAGDCTSCAVTEDKSAYWTPPMYFKDAATGQYKLVQQVGGMLSYYFLNHAPGETKITAFPHGMEMIAGDNNLRNFSAGESAPTSQKGLAQKAIGFNCLNYGMAAEGSLSRHSMPDKAYLDANCKDGIRAELMFPSCWNGKDVTSASKMDHVAYPSSVMDGTCPEGFPIRLPGLFFETIWNTAEFDRVDGEFVFSNGDPTGYGYHGDFIMGWEETFLQSAVDTCTNPSGRIQDCPLFTLQTDVTAQSCKIKKPTGILASVLAVENLVGPIPSLPGGVKLTPGPGYIVHGAAPVADASIVVVVPTLSHSAGSTIAPAATAPGGIFKENNAAIAKVAAVEPPATTEKPTLSLAANQRVSSTSYITQGGSVVKVIAIEELTTVTDELKTKTVTAESRKRAHRHGHRHN